MKNKKFTKDDLKVGYVVKFRNGHLAMVMPTHSCGSEEVITALRVPKCGWADLGEYTSDMCSLDNNSKNGNDIMEVYGYSQYAHKCIDVSTDCRELLWKREEKTCDQCIHKVVCTHVGMCEHYMAKN